MNENYEDVRIPGLIVNNLTQEQFDELLATDQLDPNQWYCTELDKHVYWGKIMGTLSEQLDLQEALDKKQNNLRAGENITIIDNVVNTSATQIIRRRW